MDGYTVLGGHILQSVDESPVCEVIHLSAPEGCHALQLEIFDVDVVVLTAQKMGKLPLELTPLVHDTLMNTVKFHPSALVMVTVRCAL
jgi:hypothetical protein